MTLKQETFRLEGAANLPLILDATFPQREGDIPTIIFVHGFKGFKDWGTHSLVARFFANKGFRFLKFNFSHSGIGEKAGDSFEDLSSFGNNTFSKELFDLDQVITFAKSGQYFDAPSEISLIGHSRGGGISVIQAAADQRVSKLVTWASLSNFRKLWSADQEAQWRENGVIYVANARTQQNMPLNVTLLDDFEQHSEKLDILSAGRSLSQPWLIVHGTKDSVVPVEHAQELHRQQGGSQLILVPDTDHVFGARHPWASESLPEALQHVCQATADFLKT